MISGAVLIAAGILGNPWWLGIDAPLFQGLWGLAALTLIVSGVLLVWLREKILREMALLFGVLFLCFLLAECCVRIFDPFPYIKPWEQNHTEYGNLVRHDPLLGWSGIPSDTGEFVSDNSRTFLRHNALGFRDIEHPVPNTAPAIVFLGDSYTWGYEVAWDDMFVNRLRKKLPRYEIYNLSMRGYGTDQEMIALRQFGPRGPVKFVIVMFSENDFGDNSQFIKYGKFKPQFILRDGQLVLTRIPVPRIDLWQTDAKVPLREPSFHERFKGWVLGSQFLNEVHFRLSQPRKPKQSEPPPDPETEIYQEQMAGQLLSALNQEVSKKGAKLWVVAIPSKKQFVEKGGGSVPYQRRLERICNAIPGVDYIDLAPYFAKTPFRTYYRRGIHLNAFGNRVVADALYDHLKRHSR